ncbi:hypothetical protein ONZ45_g14332 [Pleurotus djamor]|nr:hypothetical protein ONZ45_g14332 [Pleurotus djamor]
MADGDNVDDSALEGIRTRNSEDVSEWMLGVPADTFPLDAGEWLNLSSDLAQYLPSGYDETAIIFWDSLSDPLPRPSSPNDTTQYASFEQPTDEFPQQLLLPLPQTEEESLATQALSTLGVDAPSAEPDLYDLMKDYLFNLNTELQHSSTPIFPQDVPESGDLDEGAAGLPNWTNYSVPGLPAWFEALEQGLGIPDSMDAASVYGDPPAFVEIQDAQHEGGLTDDIHFATVPSTTTGPQASIQAHPSVPEDTSLSSSIPIRSIDPHRVDTSLDPPQGPAFRGDVGSHAVTEASERRRIYPPRFTCLVDRCNRRFTSRPNAERTFIFSIP